MPSLSGQVIAAGYEVIASITITAAGYGVAVLNPPALPLNPYMGYTFPALVQTFPDRRLTGSGRKIYRDGVIVFPPYAGGDYDVVVIWTPSSIGLDWFLQW